MFKLEDNASKLALYGLIKHLQGKGIKWIDTQMVTPVVEQFGGEYLDREEFLEMIQKVDWTKPRTDIF